MTASAIALQPVSTADLDTVDGGILPFVAGFAVGLLTGAGAFAIGYAIGKALHDSP
ncbi:MAG: hypothetical protein U0746_21590 [Gemmataceae bacterium]